MTATVPEQHTRLEHEPKVDLNPVLKQRFTALFDDWRLIVSVDGAAVAEGTVRGTDVLAFATDPKPQGGALGGESCAAIVYATDLAVERGVPVVGIWHSGGARLREGVAALDGVGRIFASETRASGRVPQISVVLGPAAGGAAYGPALTDVIIMGPAARLFVTGPDVVRRVTGEDVDALRLGGPGTHDISGVAHLISLTDDEALYSARRLASLLGAQGEVNTAAEANADPGTLVPSNHRESYDVRMVVRRVLDTGTFVELQPGWARNAVTGLGRLGGRTVGVVANDPATMAGCLDADSGDKTGRFVQMCDSLGVPLIFFADVPGYLPGVGQEDTAVIRRGAKLLHAYAAASVPRLTVVLRKSFGGAFIAMGSRGLGAHRVYAWPGAQVDVMGATAAVEVLSRRELAAELDPGRRAKLVLKLAAEHEVTTGGLARALECGAVDAVIEPVDTRPTLIAALSTAPGQRGLTRNGPL
jgi:acetyl-CoA/propionyl-CoA carboxylase carboxyl transferase subunit